MVSYAKLSGGKNVLDIGGGSGDVSLYSARKGCKVVYIDINDCLLRIVKSKAKGFENISCVKGTAENLKFVHDDFFEIIFCGEVLEHLIDDNLAISEAHRVLKPGGKYIITVPNRNALAYVILRLLPIKIRKMIFKIFRINISLHGEILNLKNNLLLPSSHKRVGYFRHELKEKLEVNKFEIQTIKGFDFLIPKIFTPLLPNSLSIFIYKLGDIFPKFSSKILIVAKKY